MPYLAAIPLAVLAPFCCSDPPLASRRWRAN